MIAWLIAHYPTVLATIGFVINELVAWSPYLKSNSILMLIANILKDLKNKP